MTTHTDPLHRTDYGNSEYNTDFWFNNIRDSLYRFVSSPTIETGLLERVDMDIKTLLWMYHYSYTNTLCPPTNLRHYPLPRVNPSQGKDVKDRVLSWYIAVVFSGETWKNYTHLYSGISLIKDILSEVDTGVEEEDIVNTPSHYKGYGGAECLDVIRGLPWSLGCATKYVWRHRHKGSSLLDLKKAEFYMRDFIKSYELGYVMNTYTEAEDLKGVTLPPLTDRPTLMRQSAWLFYEEHFKESSFLRCLDRFLHESRSNEQTPSALDTLSQMLRLVQEMILVDSQE